jgi:hypothetical protein
MKTRRCPSSCVVTPSDTAPYRCGLRRACRTNPSILFINLVMKRSAWLRTPGLAFDPAAKRLPSLRGRWQRGG